MITKQVKDWMNANVLTIKGSSTLPDAYWLMMENGIRHLPVLENGKLVGIVTLEDLRRMDSVKVAGLDVIHISNILSRLPIRRIMTENPKTISPDASLIDAARIMLNNKISALPVVENDQLVGIITEGDIFRAFVESETEKEMIEGTI